MVNNRKKVFVLLAGMTLAAFIFTMASCKHGTDSVSGSDAADNERTVLVRGTIVSEKLTVSADGRSAFPVYDNSVYYTVTAYSGSKAVQGKTSSSVPISFSVPLSRGDWIIVARGYRTNIPENQGDATLIFEGRSNTITINGTDNTFEQDITITAKPLSKLNTDKGTVNLRLYVPSSLSNGKVIAYWKQQNAGGVSTQLKQEMSTSTQEGTDYYFTFTMYDTDSADASYTPINTATSKIPAGTYEISFEFYNNTDTNPVYVIPAELIHVYKNLETNTWYKESVSQEIGSSETPEGSPWLDVQSDGTAKLTVTDDLIKDFSEIRTFYVKQQNPAPTNPDGSFVKPFTTIQAAVDKIMSVARKNYHTVASGENHTADYTICLLSDIIESSSTLSYDSSSGKPKETLVSIDVKDLPDSTIEFTSELKIKITSGSSVYRKIDVARSASNTGGIFYVNGNRAAGSSSYTFTAADPTRLTVTLENLELTGAYSTKTGAVVGMENGNKKTTGSGADEDTHGTFYGAKVVMKNCIVHDNVTKSDSGGAVFVALNNTFEAENTIFERNSTNYSGSYGNAGAVYAYSGMILDHCYFNENETSNTGTKGTDGAAGGAILINLHQLSATDNLDVIIRNCTFENNRADGSGGAIQINTVINRGKDTGSNPEPILDINGDHIPFPLVQFENVVIKNNSSEMANAAGGIGLIGGTNNQSSFKIKGTNIIEDNTGKTGSGADLTTVPCDILLPTNGTIAVTGSLSGSRIGVSFQNTSSITASGLVFTTGYSGSDSSTYSNPADPSTVFFSDSDDFIIAKTKTANDTTGQAKIITPPAGNIINGCDISDEKVITLSINRNHILENKKSYILVNAKRNNILLTGNDVDMSYRLSMYEDEIPVGTPPANPEGTGTGYYYCENSFKLVFPGTLPQGNYRLMVCATDKNTGIIYSAEYKLDNKKLDNSNTMASLPLSTTVNAGDTFHITNQDDFSRLAEIVHQGTESFEGATVYLDADITLSGIVNVISSSLDKPFKGVFDGGGYTITYDDDVSLSRYPSNYRALFSYISGPAVIRNVTIKNAGNVALTACSALVGLEKCEIDSVNNENKFPLVENVVNKANVSQSSVMSANVAGIVNQLEGGIIRNCLNTGKITMTVTNTQSYEFLGGICGKIDDTGLSKNYSHLYNCRNEGDVECTTSKSYYGVGGIVGRCVFSKTQDGNYPIAVFNCENKGQIRGGNSIGGIMGAGTEDFDDTYTMNVYNCINSGLVRTVRNETRAILVGSGYICAKPNLGDAKVINNVNIADSARNTNLEVCAICNVETATLQHNYFSSGSYDSDEYSNGQGTKFSVTNYGTLPYQSAVLMELNNWVDSNNSHGLYKSWVLEQRADDVRPSLHLDLGF